jgi:hypothetical protein
LPIQVTQAAAYLTLGPLALASTVQGFVGAILGLNASALTVIDLALAPGAAIGPSSATVNVRAEVIAAPADSFSAQQVGMHGMQCILLIPAACCGVIGQSRPHASLIACRACAHAGCL